MKTRNLVLLVTVGSACGNLTALAQQPFAQTASSTLEGNCDGSAIVTFQEFLIVGNDENAILTIYRPTNSSGPVGQTNLESALGLSQGSEPDFEAASTIGDRQFWITSHGRNKNGKLRPERARFFKTRVDVANPLNPTLAVEGTPYSGLRDDLKNDQDLGKLLEKAIGGPADDPKLAPEKDGLSIEGLAATKDRAGLLIGFRNPRPDDHALVVVLKNPTGVVSATPQKPEFGKPILLDLEKRGVRSMEFLPQIDAYVIVAGPAADAGQFDLYSWVGPPSTEVKKIASSLPLSFVPEAIAAIGNSPEILIASDDGTDECKAASPSDRKFRLEKISIKK